MLLFESAYLSIDPSRLIIESLKIEIQSKVKNYRSMTVRFESQYDIDSSKARSLSVFVLLFCKTLEIR